MPSEDRLVADDDAANPEAVGAGEGNRTLMTSLEDRACEIGVLADQAMPLIPGS
jgi:hypothetical protein